MDSSIIIYNYITTNNINGKQYVGMHTTNRLEDGYLGSGRLIIEAFDIFGKENFTKDIICFVNDISTARYNEKVFIKDYNTAYPQGYNLSKADIVHNSALEPIEIDPNWTEAYKNRIIRRNKSIPRHF